MPVLRFLSRSIVASQQCVLYDFEVALNAPRLATWAVALYGSVTSSQRITRTRTASIQLATLYGTIGQRHEIATLPWSLDRRMNHNLSAARTKAW